MDKKEKMMRVGNYALFYGIGKTEELAHFDMAIVEPAGQNGAGIRRLKDKGTLVIAYVSVIEVCPDSDMVKMLKPEDYLVLKGQRAVNEHFGNYLMDLRSKRCVDLLLHYIGRLFIQQGYDGIFLDTVGNAETRAVLDEYGEDMIIAYVEFLKRLKDRYKDMLVIQNNGLERLVKFVPGLIDGICWENPPFAREECTLWSNEVTDRLERLWKEYGIRVFLLMEEVDEDMKNAKKGIISDKIRIAESICADKGFLLYLTHHSYVEAVNLPEK